MSEDREQLLSLVNSCQDKIRELQQENKELKEKDYNHFAYLKRIDNLEEENKELKDKFLGAIDNYEQENFKNIQAIEYINNKLKYYLVNKDELKITIMNLNEIRDILKQK